MRMKEESEKVGLKLNIQKRWIMASSAITSRQIEGEISDRFYLSELQNHCGQWWQQPWNQKTLKSKGLMLKLQCFGHLMRRINSLEKILMLGKIEGWRRGWQRVRWLDSISGHEFEQALGDSGSQRSLACCSPSSCRVRHNSATEQPQKTSVRLGLNIFKVILHQPIQF